MPLQNRVTPFSELVAHPARGLLYGNRGCMHDDQGRIRRRYGTRRWIACRLEFRGWERGPKLQPGLFTELFFLDEVTALAAGHRPCALCRRADYVRLGEIWRDLHPGQVGADAIDLQLHGERVEPATRTQRHHRGGARRPPRRGVRRARRRGLARARLAAAALDARGLRRARAAPAGRGRGGDHAALAGGGAAQRLGAARAAVPSLDVTTDTFGIGEGSAAARQASVNKQVASAQTRVGGGTAATSRFHQRSIREVHRDAESPSTPPPRHGPRRRRDAGTAPRRTGRRLPGAAVRELQQRPRRGPSFDHAARA